MDTTEDRHIGQAHQVDPWTAKAESSLSLGLWQQAIMDFSKAMEINDRTAPLLYGRTKAYLKTRQLERARNDVTQAINSDPQPAYLWLRGQLNESLGDTTAALEDYRQFLHLATSEDQAWTRALAEQKIKQYESRGE